MKKQNLEAPDRTAGKQVWSLKTQVSHVLDGWTVVAQYPSSSSSATHTVESDGSGNFPSGYRCTCQGYKIHGRKKGPNADCKHTRQAKREGLK